MFNFVKGLWDAVTAPIGMVADAVGLGSLYDSTVGGVETMLGLSDAQVAHDQANEDQRNLLDRQEGFTREMAQQQHDWNRQDWLLQQQYNTPSAQRDRMLQAGFNPNMNGAIAPSTASTAVRSDLPTTPSPINTLSGLSSIISAQTEREALALAKQKTKAEVKNIETDTELKYEKALTERSQRDLATALMKSQVDVNGTLCSLNMSKERLTDAQVEEVNEKIKAITAQIDLFNNQSALLKKEVDWYDTKTKAQLNEIASRIGLNGAQASQCVAMAQLIGQQAKTEYWRTDKAQTESQIANLNLFVQDATSHSRITVAQAEGDKAQLYIDCPQWSKEVSTFVGQFTNALSIYSQFLGIGSKVAMSAGL